MKKNLYFIVFILFFCTASAKNKATVDEIDSILKITESSISTNFNTAQNNLKILKRFIDKNEYDDYLGYYYALMGYNHFTNLTPDTALKYYQLALKEFEKYDNKSDAALILSRIGSAYLMMGKPEISTDYYYKAMKNFDFESWINKHSYQESSKSAKIYRNYLVIINEYAAFQVENYRKKEAKENFLKIIDIAKEVRDYHYLAIANANIAYIYYSFEFKTNIDTALKYYNSGYKYALKLKSNRFIQYFSLYLAMLYLEKNDLDKSQFFLNNSFKYSLQYKNTDYYNRSLYVSSKYYSRLGEYNQALDSLNKIKLNYTKLDNEGKKFYLDFYTQKFELFLNINKPDSASKYYKMMRKSNNVYYTGYFNEGLSKIDNLYKDKLNQKNYEVLKARAEVGRKNNIILSILLFIGIATTIYFTYRFFRTNTVKNKLELAHIDLKKAYSMKDKFISILAHDIKNPIANIVGTSQLIKYNFETLSDEQRKLLTTNCLDSASSLMRLIEDLLSWSRATTDTIEYRPVPVNLFSNVSIIQDIFQLELLNKQIKVIVDIDQNLDIIADVNMLNTILRNLFSNAIKFSIEESEIIIWAKEVNDDVEIGITDNGLGISDDTIEQLFSIDKIISTKGTKGETGTGLGLLLTKEFLAKHQSILEVDSKLNQGSTFSFKLKKIK